MFHIKRIQKLPSNYSSSFSNIFQKLTKSSAQCTPNTPSAFELHNSLTSSPMKSSQGGDYKLEEAEEVPVFKKIFKTEKVNKKVTDGYGEIESEHEIIQVFDDPTRSATQIEHKVFQVIRPKNDDFDEDQKIHCHNDEVKKKRELKKKQNDDMSNVLKEYKKTIYQGK
jgi:hypothetical protein